MPEGPSNIALVEAGAPALSDIGRIMVARGSSDHEALWQIVGRRASDHVAPPVETDPEPDPPAPESAGRCALLDAVGNDTSEALRFAKLAYQG